jgi:hypothetical protein
LQRLTVGFSQKWVHGICENGYKAIHDIATVRNFCFGYVKEVALQVKKLDGRLRVIQAERPSGRGFRVFPCPFFFHPYHGNGR